MECFTINFNKIEGRLDCHFYRPEFTAIVTKLKQIKYPVVLLSELTKRPKGDIQNFGAYSLCNFIKFIDKGIPFIKVENYDEYGIKWNTVQYISEEVHQILPKSKLKKDDVLLSMAGTIGISTLFKENFEANSNQAIAKIRLSDERVTPEFLSTFFNSKIGYLQSLRISNGAVQLNINLGEIGQILIPILPKQLQDKIASLIYTAYSLKKSRESEAQKLLDSLNDYVLDELGIKLPELKDRMVYVVNSDEVKHKRANAYYYQPKFEEVEKAIKKGKFEVKELKKFITKIHYGASVKNEYVDDGIPLLRIMNLKSNKIDLRDVVKLPETMKKDLGNAFVNEGDLLISRSGTVGVVSVVPKEAEGFAFGSFMIKFCLNEGQDKSYIAAWLNTKLQKLLTEREKIGAIQGNITIETIENFKIPLPPFDVQNKIAEEVKKRMQKAEQLQKEAKEELVKAKQEVEKIILGDN